MKTMVCQVFHLNFKYLNNMKTIKIEEVTNISTYDESGDNICMIITTITGKRWKANGDIDKIENTLYCYYGFESYLIY